MLGTRKAVPPSFSCHASTSCSKHLESDGVSVGRQLLLFDELDRGSLKGVHWYLFSRVTANEGYVTHEGSFTVRRLHYVSVVCLTSKASA